MEKPFGTDLASARELNATLHEVVRRVAGLPDRPLPRQGGGAEHPRAAVRERHVRADLEPRPHRPRPDRRARDALDRHAAELLRADRRVSGHGRDPPVPGARLRRDGAADVARAAGAGGREDEGLRLDAAARPGDVVRGQYEGYREEDGVRPTPTRRRSWPLRVAVDNWRWAGVPFFLRTGKRLAESRQLLTLAFKQPPRRMFPIDCHHVAESNLGCDTPDIRSRRSAGARRAGTCAAAAP